MKNAQETIIDIISNRVNLLNHYINDGEVAERFRHELNGMLICLKNINEDDRFYNINYWSNRIEFGYYDEQSTWVLIA